MSGSHRVTRRFAAAGVAALLAAGFAAPSIAIAAEGDSERGFPELIPEWYVTAPPAAYGTAAPAPTIDESLKSKGFKVAYYRPGGGAPSSGQGDLELSYSHPPSAAAVDEVRFRFSDFENLSSDLGTIITDAIYLPIKDASTAEAIVNEVAQSGGVYFSDSALVIDRQAEPCAVKKLQPTYEFQVALLGSNGYKYLADVAVSLGERPESACATEKPTTEKAVTVTREGIGETSEEKPTAEAEVVDEQETEGSPETSNEEAGIDWGALSGAGIVLVIVFVGMKFIRRSRRNAYEPAEDPAEESTAFVDDDLDDELSNDRGVQ